MKNMTWITVSATLLAALSAQADQNKNLSITNNTQANLKLKLLSDGSSKALSYINLDQSPEHEGGEPCAGSSGSK